MARTIAVILARRGSKGLPGKNTAPVAGRPCVAWTIDDALAAQTVDSVLVSSDDPAVLDIGSRMGALCFVRPREVAGDTATVDDAVRVSLRGVDAETVVVLYGNVPVRPAGLIDRAARRMAETGCDSVQSYERVGKHHPWWTARIDEAGGVRAWEGDVLNGGVYRRQDLPPAYIPTGGVIVVRRAALEREVGAEGGPHAFLGRDRRGVIDAEGSTVDIDSRIDLLVADAVLRERGRAAA
jgi:N-acylneuraminate cytidylyltransferase